MPLVEKDDLIYYITEESVQYEAQEQIGRQLTEDEMATMRKKLEYGIGENMLFIWNAVFEELRYEEND
jgi:hypothetical protein